MFVVQILVLLHILSAVRLAGCFLFYTEVDLGKQSVPEK